jgi:hypothetical protein
MDPTPRGKEATALEQAVSRAMRDNLALVQHTAKELSQAIEDFVAACSSTRNANMLPSMLRAQTASASLTSMLDVLSRLLTSSLQPARAGASESYLATLAAAEPAAAVQEPAVAPPPAPPRPAPMPVVPEPPPAPAPVAAPPPPPPQPEMPRTGTVLMSPTAEVEAVTHPAAHVLEHGIPIEEAPPAPAPEPVVSAVAAPPEPVAAPPAPVVPEPVSAPPAAPPSPAFRVEDLPSEQQELHRRANRHAKVSMQDIYLLRPKDVQLGRQNRDICTRLKGDIEKARKEYVRRFSPILEHPVDYFHHWMVEVLAEGKPEVLGVYPYPSAVTRQ